MTSLLTTAVVVPSGLALLLLPPVLQFEVSPLDLYSIWPPFAWLYRQLLFFFTTSSPPSFSLDGGGQDQRQSEIHLLSRLLSTLGLDETTRALIRTYDDAFPGLFAAAGLGLLGYWAACLAISATKDVFKQRGFHGRDLLKIDPTPVPESLGLPTAAVYMLLLFVFIPFRYFSSSTSTLERAVGGGAEKGMSLTSILDEEGRMDGRDGFPHHQLASFLSALLSFSCAIILGFLDDVFDIRWRYKLPIPLVASIPVLVVYYAGGGFTSVVVPGWPSFLRSALRTKIVDLGPIYYLYMSMLSTFCTNSINILAGINGVEVGQALVISVSLALNDALYLDPRAGQPGSRSSAELLHRHLLSLYLQLPLIGVCLALLRFNAFPSTVFVGDTFCYFAGMVFATTGILGHFSKTLLLFFTPQIANFLLSVPQLFALVPNPRHRVPRFHAASNSLYPSIQFFAPPPAFSDPAAGKDASTFLATGLPNTSKSPLRPSSRLATLVLKALSFLGLVQLEFWDPLTKNHVKSTTNLTILNAILVLRGVRCLPFDTLQSQTQMQTQKDTDTDTIKKPYSGPDISEYGLWLHMMAVQVAGSLLAFAIRYWVAAVVFP
ncbi:hypothetical protein BCV70DRAFT_200566 [Testicularia cyperi]|uniref:UDP-N-acetylglucosamine--dolichyl-phosphate N-acetylglucosaminephosphotransferase n=1 Tax=Testicularia cyperi TaxID=1882483 RepID=A0A317XMW0_9BASI|nr:hypothetical protein BCV70DRAFT_200566 [Testicularia cyperi]